MNKVINLSEIPSYNHTTKNISEKKSILQFLPTCLYELSKKETVEFRGKKLKTAYLVDLVHGLILKYYFKKENKFNLSSTILKEKYGYLYNYYIGFLLEKKTIVLLSKHQKGKNSRIYALIENIFRNEITRFHNQDKVIIKKYKNKISQILSDEADVEKGLIDYKVKQKLVSDLFFVDIDFVKSIYYLDHLKIDDIDIYNRNRYSVECVKDKHIFYHFDNYGRMHTNFTILKTYIRKSCLILDGEETVEIDIKNSQPLFLSKLVDSAYCSLVNKEELELFKYLTINGIYYEFIMEKTNITDKSIVKQMTYKVLFGRNNPNSMPDKIFRSIFPTIHDFIKKYKKENGDYRILAYDLQKAESNLLFNKIVKQIISVFPNIKIVTVHDSIIIPKTYKSSVHAIFDTILYEEFGLI